MLSTKVNIFANVKTEEIDKLMKSSLTRNFSKGDIIIHAGDVGKHLYIILMGEVKVLQPSRDGSTQKLLSFLSAGEYFGEIGLIMNSKRTADVIATKTSKILLLSEKNALDFMAKHKEVMFNVLKNSLTRIYELSIDTEISAMSAYDKIYYFLKHRLSRQDENEQEYVVKKDIPSVAKIADYIGLHRSTVHDNLKLLYKNKRLIQEEELVYFTD